MIAAARNGTLITEVGPNSVVQTDDAHVVASPDRDARLKDWSAES